MNRTKVAEGWLASRVEGARTMLAKAAAAAWTAAVPLLLLKSGFSTANKTLGSVLWVSATLNLFLLAVVCWHRRENRRREVDQAKLPDPPALDGFDLSVLIRLVAYDVGSGVHRLANDMGVESFKVSHSTDKLLACGYVDYLRESSAGSVYRANAAGRSRCLNPPKK